MSDTDTRTLPCHTTAEGTPIELELVIAQTAERLCAWKDGDGRAALFADLRALLAETERAMPVEPEAREAYTALWRERLHPLFLQAPFIRRCVERPCGYAGDYEMMNMIYRNAAEGDTPLGRVLHRFMNAWRGAVAVRNRRRWILPRAQEHMRDREGRVRIASVASGPAVEMQDLVRESFLADRADLLCIDQDAESLECAERGVRRAIEETGAECRVTFSNGSVKGLLATRGAEHEPQDFLYSLGLYDYLPERPAQRLTSVLYGMLHPGGRLVIGNLAPHTDARFAIELICDWKLIYRSGEEVLRLGALVPAEAVAHLDTEPTGMNLFLVVTRPG